MTDTTFRAALVERFGQVWVAALEATTGCHAIAMRDVPPPGDARLIYGLLEALDFECPCYGWRCRARGAWAEELQGVESADLKEFLLLHRDPVIATPGVIPSALGLVAGTFDFLWPSTDD